MSEKMKALLTLVVGICLCVILVVNYYVRNTPYKFDPADNARFDIVQLHDGYCDGDLYTIVMPDEVSDHEAYFAEFCSTVVE